MHQVILYNSNNLIPYPLHFDYLHIRWPLIISEKRLLLLINSLLSNPDNDIHYIRYQVLKIRPATKAYNGPNTNINILINIIKTTFIIYIVQYII